MQEEQRLRHRDIQPTAVRIRVLRYLLETDLAVSLPELETELAPCDKSTIYRTLKTFEESSMVHRIDDGTGIMKYGLCLEDCTCAPTDQHAHFHCTNCKKTFCLNNRRVPPIPLPTGFATHSINLVVRGTCAECN